MQHTLKTSVAITGKAGGNGEPTFQSHLQASYPDSAFNMVITFRFDQEPGISYLARGSLSLQGSQG